MTFLAFFSRAKLAVLFRECYVLSRFFKTPGSLTRHDPGKKISLLNFRPLDPQEPMENHEGFKPPKLYGL